MIVTKKSVLKVRYDSHIIFDSMITTLKSILKAQGCEILALGSRKSAPKGFGSRAKCYLLRDDLIWSMFPGASTPTTHSLSGKDVSRPASSTPSLLFPYVHGAQSGLKVLGFPYYTSEVLVFPLSPRIKSVTRPMKITQLGNDPY